MNPLGEEAIKKAIKELAEREKRRPVIVLPQVLFDWAVKNKRIPVDGEALDVKYVVSKPIEIEEI